MQLRNHCTAQDGLRCGLISNERSFGALQMSTTIKTQIEDEPALTMILLKLVSKYNIKLTSC